MAPCRRGTQTLPARYNGGRLAGVMAASYNDKTPLVLNKESDIQNNYTFEAKNNHLHLQSGINVANHDKVPSSKICQISGHGERWIAGVVLGREGGALPQMLLPFRMGLGGPLGSGLQPFPWIHVEDLAGILLHALEGEGVRGELEGVQREGGKALEGMRGSLERERGERDRGRLGGVEGVLNGVAPSRCTQGEFAEALAGSLGRAARLRVPAALVQAALGPERALLLLQGQWVEPRRTLASGYRYQFPRLQAAVDHLLH
ncbi:epimerase family protein SDR39U1-like [Rhinoraja longicauda]